MPKAKWTLNTIYISERLQESLCPISRCALTTVVAPMGYGKTTAVEWYLAERARAEEISVIRISVYSANLAIFWRSVQDAFARAGFDLLRDYDCPSDAAGGGLLIEDLCPALAGERACYIFLDDFHLHGTRAASLIEARHHQLAQLACATLQMSLRKREHVENRHLTMGNIRPVHVNAQCGLERRQRELARAQGTHKRM